MNNNYSDMQLATMQYCVTKGFRLEGRLKELEEGRANDISANYEDAKAISDEEKRIHEDMAAIKKQYDEALNARYIYEKCVKKAEYYSNKAKKMEHQWGF